MKAKAQLQMAENMVELADYSAKTPTFDATRENTAVEGIVLRSGALAGNQAAIDSVKSGVDKLKDTSLGNSLTLKLGNKLNGF